MVIPWGFKSLHPHQKTKIRSLCENGFFIYYCISTAYEVIFNIVNEINLNRQVSYGKQA